MTNGQNLDTNSVDSSTIITQLHDNATETKQLLVDTLKTEMARMCAHIDQQLNERIKAMFQTQVMPSIMQQSNETYLRIQEQLNFLSVNISETKTNNTSVANTIDTNMPLNELSLYDKLYKDLNNKFEPHFSTLHKEVSYCLQVISTFKPASLKETLPALKTQKPSSQKPDRVELAIQPNLPSSSQNGRQYVPSAVGESGQMISTKPSSAKPAIVGSRKVENSKIIAADPKIAVQVKNLENNITKEDLLEYLKQVFGTTHSYNIEELNVRSGDYTSFKIVLKKELLREVLNPRNWPEGVEVREFQFFRHYNRNTSRYNHSRRRPFN